MKSAEDIIAEALASLAGGVPALEPQPVSVEKINNQYAELFSKPDHTVGKVVEARSQHATLIQQRDAAVAERNTATEAAEAAYVKITELERINAELNASLAISIKTINFIYQNEIENANMIRVVLERLGGLK